MRSRPPTIPPSIDDAVAQAGAPLRAITLKDIASHCGVSLGTVSLALRDDPRISSETRARVTLAAATLGYDPTAHQAARRLALSKHGRHILNQVIALIVPEGFHKPGYFSELMQGIMDVLVEEGFCALTTYCYTLPDDRSKAVTLPHALRSGAVDGLINMVRPEHIIEMMGQLTRQPGFRLWPVVSLIWPIAGYSSVGADDEAAGYAIATHLLEQGHRYLLHFTFVLTVHSSYVEPQALRLAGARRALSEHGLDPDRHLLVVDLNNHRWLDPTAIYDDDDPKLMQVLLPDQRYIDLVDLLRARPEFTGIIASNDPSALRAWRLLEEAGFRVPDDISIVGYDDTTPRLGPDGQNLLTSVRVPLHDIGREAARIIIARVKGEMTEEQQLRLPAELIVRASSSSE